MPKLYLAFIFSVYFLSSGWIAAKASPDTFWTYKTVDHHELKLSVFLPEGYELSVQSFPTFVVFHGGSWRVGTPDMHYPDCAYWASRGMIAVSVDYRLRERDQVEVPLECVKDAKSAIRYLRANAVELKVDADRIVAAGGSAGGQMAASAAMLRSSFTDDAADDVSIVSIPNAVILYNPYWETGCSPELTPPNSITKGLPPMITFIGGKDQAIPVEGIKAFHDKLKAHGNDSELYIGHEGTHGFCNGRNPLNPYFYWSLKLQDQFLVKHGMLRGEDSIQRPDGVPLLKSALDFTAYY